MEGDKKRGMSQLQDLKKIQSRISKLKEKQDLDEEDSDNDCPIGSSGDKKYATHDLFYDDEEYSSNTDQDNHIQIDAGDHSNQQNNSQLSSKCNSSISLENKNQHQQRPIANGLNSGIVGNTDNESFSNEEIPSRKNFIDPCQDYYYFPELANSNNNNIAPKKNGGNHLNDNKLKSSTGYLKGISEIKEESDETERDPNNLFNIPSSIHETPRVYFESAIVNSQSWNDGNDPNRSDYRSKDKDSRAWQQQIDTVRYPESGKYPDTIKYIDSLNGNGRNENLVGNTVLGSGGTQYQYLTALGKTSQFNYTSGTTQIDKAGTGRVTSALGNKLSDRFMKLEKDIYGIQVHFNKIKNENQGIMSDRLDMHAKNYKVQRQVNSTARGPGGVNLIGKDSKGPQENSGKFSAETYLSNAKKSIPSLQTSQRKSPDDKTYNGAGVEDSMKKSTIIKEGSDSQISFSNREYRTYNVNKANREMVNQAKGEFYRISQRSLRSDPANERSEKLGISQENQFEDKKNGKYVIAVNNRADFLIDGNNIKPRSLADETDKYGNDFADPRFIDYENASENNDKRETVSERLFEYKKNKGHPYNEKPGKYVVNGNNKAKTEKSGVTNYISKDQIQLSDDDEDDINSYGCCAKPDCDGCGHLKHKLIELQRDQKLMKKKQVISVATMQRDAEKIRKKVPIFGEMCRQALDDKRNYGDGFDNKQDLYDALVNYRKSVC